VTAPFTLAQFLGVFVAYNAAIWPLQILAYILGLLAVVTISLRSPTASHVVPLTLAALWAINAIGYHALLFRAINPAALLFAGLFSSQAIFFAAIALTRKGLPFVFRPDVRSVTGAAFIFYAMVIYPLIGIWMGHGGMAGPMFGVAPCPTTIFTLGLFLLARSKIIRGLAVIPLLWSLVGLAATIQLGMLEDFGLPFAGSIVLLVLTFDTVAQSQFPINGKGNSN
jgi:hypothetical protein